MYTCIYIYTYIYVYTYTLTAFRRMCNSFHADSPIRLAVVLLSVERKCNFTEVNLLDVTRAIVARDSAALVAQQRQVIVRHFTRTISQPRAKTNTRQITDITYTYTGVRSAMSGPWAKKGYQPILHYTTMIYAFVRFYTSGYQLPAARALHRCVRGLTLQGWKRAQRKIRTDLSIVDKYSWVCRFTIFKCIDFKNLIIEAKNLNVGISCGK